jgi:hypothetical protein
MTSVRGISRRPCLNCGSDQVHYGLKCGECQQDTQPSVSVWDRKAKARIKDIADRNGAKKGGRAKAARRALEKRL